MKRFTWVIALFALALPTFAQQSFQEKIDVNAVLLDVIVTDSKGNQILGLGKDDFIVKENGVVQTVDSVDYFTNRRLLDQREEQAPFKVERVREDRYFIFFFDKLPEAGAMFNELQRARRAVLDIVRDEMQPTDYVAIVAHDVRLKVYTDFTNDPKKIDDALGDVLRFGKGQTSAPAGDGPSILRNLDHDAMMSETGSVYDALNVLADATRQIRARKNLVLFSPGIVDHRETIRNDMLLGRLAEFDDAIESLNGANVAVYGVQMTIDPGITPLLHQRLNELSEETGGRYFQFNTSFEPALDRIENTNSGYYLVTFTSRHPKGEKGYQKVDVQVKNPEFRVVARSGYLFGS